jgi:hypothetical protein
MSIASIQSKYPSAIWFDSAHTGTESGTVDEPYNTIGEAMSAASDGGVIAIKDGTHNVTQITMPKSLTFVGESTQALLSTSGSTYGGAINARLTSHSIKIETLKIYHNTTSNTYGLITAGNVAEATVTVEGCILEMGPQTPLAGSARGWFAGESTPITSLAVSDSVITGGSSSSSFGAVFGGSASTQDGFNSVDFQRNTFVITAGSATKFASYSNGITSSVFKNNIFVGNGNNEVLGFTPATASNNCYHNNGISSGSGGVVFADPQFVDSANSDYRLRPSSPCIGAGTAS